MPHQLNIFLLLFGIVQGALLALFLFRRKEKDLSFVYLMLLLTVTSLQMTLKVISKFWMMKNITTAYLISYHLPFLMGPLLFLFIRSHAKRDLAFRDLFHFLPFVLMCMVVFFPKIPGTQLYWLSMQGETALKVLSLLIYVVMSWNLVQANPDLLKKFIPFIGGITLAEFAVIIGLAFIYLNHPVYSSWRFLFIPLTLLVYWMSYQVMLQPDYFFTTGAKVATLFRQPLIKYSNSGLKDEDAQQIEAQLLRLLKEQKPFLDSGLTIDGLAHQLGTTRHKLSQVINMRFNKTYGDLMNDYRIGEVQERLLNPKMRNFTIAAIALDSGFNSVSAFNEIFKKKTGKTPSKYREELLHQMTA